MASSRANVALHGENAEAVEDYAEKHDCSKAKAVRHYVKEGREREELEEVVADGGVVGKTERDQVLEQLVTLSAFGAIVGILMITASTELADITGMVMLFAAVGAGCGLWRAKRARDRGGFDGSD